MSELITILPMTDGTFAWETAHRSRFSEGYQSGSGFATAQSAVADAKAHGFGGDLCLNLGAGEMAISGYTSLDAHPYLPDTVVCRFPPLPYGDGSVAHIYAGHVLEHIAPWDVQPLLGECARVLVAGGTLTLVCPDADKGRLMVESRRIDHVQYALIVAGAQYDDMPHWSLWNRERIAEAIRRAGLALDDGYDWRNDERVYDRSVLWQCGARGVKR